ncbi:hypothetical protein QR685DRAFT_10463 [Neurospora intermedia]|uniref:Uncharacterized protein n=1 Tax=Neurospora intermedia TaxID=5142 RepID=A0ABR3DP63_NEUIN
MQVAPEVRLCALCRSLPLLARFVPDSPLIPGLCQITFSSSVPSLTAPDIFTHTGDDNPHSFSSGSCFWEVRCALSQEGIKTWSLHNQAAIPALDIQIAATKLLVDPPPPSPASNINGLITLLSVPPLGIYRPSALYCPLRATRCPPQSVPASTTEAPTTWLPCAFLPNIIALSNSIFIQSKTAIYHLSYQFLPHHQHELLMLNGSAIHQKHQL